MFTDDIFGYIHSIIQYCRPPMWIIFLLIAVAIALVPNTPPPTGYIKKINFATGNILADTLTTNKRMGPVIETQMITPYALATPLKNVITPESYGARGDAAWAHGAGLSKPYVTIKSGATALHVAFGVFRASDVGKYIEVGGAGPSGTVHRTYVVSYLSPTKINLQDAAQTTVAGFQDILYGSDDTVAVQDALNTCKGVVFSASMHLVKNLIVPNCRTINIFPTAGGTSESSTTTIRAMLGGDTRYLLGTYNWVNDYGYADAPFFWSKMIFDGGGIVQDVYANQAFGTHFDTIMFNAGARYGMAEYSVTKNGTKLESSSGPPNNKLFFCQAAGNGSHGIYNDGKATDTQIIGGFYFSNGGYQIYFKNSSGLIVQGVHTYGSNNLSAWFGQYGFGTQITGNLFETEVVIDSINPTSRTGVFGPANTLGGMLTVNFSDNLSNTTFRSTGNNYVNINTSFGQIKNNFNGISHTVISDGDTFQSSQPYTWSAGASSLGRIYAIKSYSYGGQFGTNAPVLYDGFQIPSTASAANELNLIKNLSDTGISTTFTVTARVLSFDMAGFTISGEVDVWSYNSDLTSLESATCNLRALYYRAQNGKTSVKAAQSDNCFSTGNGIAVAAFINDTVVAGGTNTVTITFTITHPRAPDQYSSAAQIRLSSRNRSVSSLSVQ